MKTMTGDRQRAIEVYVYVCWACVNMRKKHLRLPVWVQTYLEDLILPYWGRLTHTEQTSVLFLFNERTYMDVVYKGPFWKLALGVFYLRNKTMDIAAMYVMNEHKHLN